MKRFLILALSFVAAASLFAAAPQLAGSSHASGGYDHDDMAIVIMVNPIAEGSMWLNARYSYPFLFSEGERLLDLVQAAASVIDVAVANKTTIAYQRLVGKFFTDGSALVTVSFKTDGYEASYAVVQISANGNNVILLLNKKDVQDLINVLGKSHGLVDDYQKQVALLK